MRRRYRDRRTLAGALLAAVALASSCGGGRSSESGEQVAADPHTLATSPLAPGQFELVTLSTLPDAVTGGDVLVGLRGVEANEPIFVTRNGTDVTAGFQRTPDGMVIGLVSGLHDGENVIGAVTRGGDAALRVRNHPLTGPVISGPHQRPFICQTEDAGLGEPLDANCSIEPRSEWFYRSLLDQSFHPLGDPFAAYPPDVLTTETTDGRAVPFVVRVESLTLNRGIARIAVLDDPHARGPSAPFDARNWNHRVFYVFGESCGVGYRQGINDPAFVLGGIPGTVSGDRALINFAGGTDRLGKGDAVVHSTLSAFGVHCNPLISLETTMMVKEHIIEQYGLVEAMVGTNGSGAALQQYNAINNAPGLLTAAMPTATFADVLTTAMTVADCGLLVHYYSTSDLDWSDSKRAAVDGHLPVPYSLSICQSWNDTFIGNLDPANGCDGAVPREVRYDPETNPRGVRCTLQDANVNIFGRDPQTGFARRPLDNFGVQYGLGALNDGALTVREFLDLNRNIGGFDIDGHIVPTRMRMDPVSEAISYRMGGIIGRGALAETPVMDLAPYLDIPPLLNIHEAVRPFIVRARLRKYSGQDATQSIWRGIVTQPDAYPVMEKWFTALERDGSPDRVQAIIAAKPAEAEDSCVFGTFGGRFEFPDALQGPLGFVTVPLAPGAPLPDSDVPLRLAVPEDFDANTGPCQNLLPVTRTPRMVAGMPLTDDVIKCQLKPVDPADYSPALSEAELAAVRNIFPQGVCDWTKPAAHDVEKSLLWPSIGGTTLATDADGNTAPFELEWRIARSEPL